MPHFPKMLSQNLVVFAFQTISFSTYSTSEEKLYRTHFKNTCNIKEMIKIKGSLLTRSFFSLGSGLRAFFTLENQFPFLPISLSFLYLAFLSEKPKDKKIQSSIKKELTSLIIYVNTISRHFCTLETFGCKTHESEKDHYQAHFLI